MSGHIPTVAALKTGHIKVRFHNGSEYLAVSGGFVEVDNINFLLLYKRLKQLKK